MVRQGRTLVFARSVRGDGWGVIQKVAARQKSGVGEIDAWGSSMARNGAQWLVDADGMGVQDGQWKAGWRVRWRDKRMIE